MKQTDDNIAMPRSADRDGEALLDLIHRVQQAGERLFTLVCNQPDVTPRQHNVLRAIAHEPGVSQTRLVELTGIDRSTLSDIVRRMASKAWCTRKRSRHDARAYGVQLTTAGAEVLRRSTLASATVEDRLTGIVGEKRALFSASLLAITDALGRDTANLAAAAMPARRMTKARLAKSRG